MNYFWVFMVSAFSISLPATVSLVRRKRMGKRYRPLLILLIVGLINEFISYGMIRWHHNNLVNSNLYTYGECLLLLWFFYSIKNQRLSWIYLSVTLATLIWILDNGWLHSLNHNNSIFRIFSSILVIWLSMDKINQLLMTGATDRFKTTDLLICTAFLTYYAYRTLLHIFNLFTLSTQRDFTTLLWLIHTLINFLTNIILTLAILCIPRQKNYTRYS